jgi:ubiquinone/menaquinone biosynthesis C-methylase UbiE
MSDRGENSFVKFPKVAAKLYDSMMKKDAMRLQRVQIAEELTHYINEGRILDIGTGHGRLLAEIFEKNPKIELYGLDISEKMVKLAKLNLKNIPVNLKQGNIIKTDFNEDYFDLITCTGSFYLWNSPTDALNEIYRIIKPQSKVIFFETHKEYNKDELDEAIKQNLQKESFFNRKIIPIFLKKQLRMTYDIMELEEIINKSLFKNNFSINKITLANLSIWLKIEFRKD